MLDDMQRHEELQDGIGIGVKRKIEKLQLLNMMPLYDLDKFPPIKKCLSVFMSVSHSKCIEQH